MYGAHAQCMMYIAIQFVIQWGGTVHMSSESLFNWFSIRYDIIVNICLGISFTYMRIDEDGKPFGNVRPL